MGYISTIPPASYAAPVMWLDRCAVFGEIAHGGFASILLGRLVEDDGSVRTVAIKRLRSIYAEDENAVAMFADEARLMMSIQHRNVLSSLGVVEHDDELFIIMEYVDGLTLRYLLKQAHRSKRPIPLNLLAAIIGGVLDGLHAAHDTCGIDGEPLGLVHRDVTPDNILVGSDGVPRILDFGVARSIGQVHETRNQELRGKLSYVTPEQITGGALTRRTDVFSASAVLWEALTGKKLFRGRNVSSMVAAVLQQKIEPPSTVADCVDTLDDIVMRGLSRAPDDRWADAAEMAAAFRAVVSPASTDDLGRYVRETGSEKLAEGAQRVAAVERVPLDVPNSTC